MVFVSEPAQAVTSNVYRFYNFRQGAHFYTKSTIEKAYLEGPGGNWTYRYEGVAFQAETAPATDRVAVQRLYKFRQGVHFYTANNAEYLYVLATAGSEYRYEDVAFYAWPASGGVGIPVYRFYNFRQGVHFYTTSTIEKAQLEGSGGNWTFRYEGIAYNALPAP